MIVNQVLEALLFGLSEEAGFCNNSMSAGYSQAGDIHQTKKKEKKMSIAAPEREEGNGDVGYLPEKYTRIKWLSYEWVATAAKTGGKTRPFCTFGVQQWKVLT